MKDIQFALDETGLTEDDRKRLCDFRNEYAERLVAETFELARRVAKFEERTILGYIRDTPELARRPSDLIMNGGGFVDCPVMQPCRRCSEDGCHVFLELEPVPNTIERFYVAPLFLAFPKSVPTELKGIG